MPSLITINKQPYISTKNETFRAAVPAWSRPYTNGKNSTEANADIAGQTGGSAHYATEVNSWNRTRPIKHWRKQLNPVGVSGRSRSAVSIQGSPGSNVIIKEDCCSSSGNLLQFDIQKISIASLQTQTDDGCLSCDPVSLIIRPTAGMNTKQINPRPSDSSTAQVFQNYNFDSRSYLRSRNKSYTTNQSGAMKPDITYSKPSSTGCCREAIPYSDDNATGTQIRASFVFPPPTGELCSSKPVDIIVKPNNKQFFQQGAVSSSSRIERLKYNTVTANANGFTTAWGAAAASAGKYRADGAGPYFIKSKNNVCTNSKFHKKGDATICYDRKLNSA